MTTYHRGTAWKTFTYHVRPIIQAMLPAPCVDPCRDPAHPCTGLVQTGSRWDVAHRVSYHLDPFALLTLEAVGPAHAHCNRTNGGREGRAKQLRRSGARDPRLPGRDSGW